MIRLIPVYRRAPRSYSNGTSLPLMSCRTKGAMERKQKEEEEERRETFPRTAICITPDIRLPRCLSTFVRVHRTCDRVFHACLLPSRDFGMIGRRLYRESFFATLFASLIRGKSTPCLYFCFQTSCTMDQNLARLQNPHRFLRENRFLEGEDPSE